MSMMDLDFVGFKVVYRLLGHDALNTSKINSKSILCQKNIISIALIVSHTCTTMGKKLKNFNNHMRLNS